jgi:GNAT superfamily N-acetyltransferase
VHIRQAVEADAEAAARLMRRSIRLLCTADHHCDSGIVRAWLANKRPEIFRGWLARPGNIILVAEAADGRLLGVAGADRGGEITLNYVGPEARFMGVSTALVAELERRLAALGVAAARLTSTQTAHQFYIERGYGDAGPPETAFGGMAAFPMSKQLSAG